MLNADHETVKLLCELEHPAVPLAHTFLHAFTTDVHEDRSFDGVKVLAVCDVALEPGGLIAWVEMVDFLREIPHVLGVGNAVDRNGE